MGYRTNVTTVMTNEIFETFIKEKMHELGNMELTNFKDGSVAMQWNHIKWDSMVACEVFEDVWNEVQCSTEEKKAFKLCIIGEDDATEMYSNPAGDIVFPDVQFETTLPNIPEDGEYGYRTTIPTNVKKDIEQEVKKVNQNYKVRSIIRMSSHKDDDKLYKVVAENIKNNTYTYWGCYNATIKSLNYGHYNVQLSKAMQLLWQ